MNTPAITPPGAPRLSFKITTTGGLLHVDYEIFLPEAPPLLIFDALIRRTQNAWKHDAALAWASARAKGTLTLKRIIPPLPKNKDVEMAITPWAHRLDPGNRLTGKIAVSLPVWETNPYYTLEKPQRFSETAVERIVLEVDAVALLPGIRGVEIENTPGLLRMDKAAFKGGKLPLTRLTASVAAPAGFTMLKSDDVNFEPL